MLRRLTIVFIVSLGIAAGPSMAQIVTGDMDDRGIPTIAPLIEAVDDAVVNISVVSDRPTQTSPLFRDPFFQPFLPPPEEVPQQRQMSAGSGVIVDAQEGYILTNNHVIENADKIRVVLRDNRRFDAELVGRDPATDIAVLRIDADNLTDIPLGDSEELRVGDFVVAIGNPFGLGQTVTSGIVSALGRSGINPEGYEDFIQTDASINPGNSGGALITLNGKLIGINTAIIAPNGGGNVGIGFAVPIDMAMAVMDQLVEFGEVQRGRLGVMIQDFTPDLAEALGVDAGAGALVASVEPDTPAEQAGLAAGDVIIEVNGETVEGSADLRQKIGLRRPGEDVELTYLRGQERRKTDVQLADSGGTQTASREIGASDALAGVRLSQLDQSHPAWGNVEGVVVSDVAPGSRAASAGLQAGDVITALNMKAVDSLSAIDRALENASGALALSVWRDGRQVLVVIRS